MSQMGMQMPGAGARRRPAFNVYTGLMFMAVVCLVAAVALVFMQAQKVGPANQTGPMKAVTIHPAPAPGQTLKLGE